MNDIRYILETPQELSDVSCSSLGKGILVSVQLFGAVLVLWEPLTLFKHWAGARVVEEVALSCHKPHFSIWQISLACASWIPCLSLVCGVQEMSVFDFRIPLVRAGHCLADSSLLCIHQKAGLGCLNTFIFNVELKKKRQFWVFWGESGCSYQYSESEYFSSSLASCWSLGVSWLLAFAPGFLQSVLLKDTRIY